MNTSPSGSRPIAPVGQSIMQAGFLQCWHEFGQNQAASEPPTPSLVHQLRPRSCRRAAPAAKRRMQVGAAQAQWPQRTQLSWIDHQERARDLHAIQILEHVLRVRAAAAPARRSCSACRSAAMRRIRGSTPGCGRPACASGPRARAGSGNRRAPLRSCGAARRRARRLRRTGRRARDTRAPARDRRPRFAAGRCPSTTGEHASATSPVVNTGRLRAIAKLVNRVEQQVEIRPPAGRALIASVRNRSRVAIAAQARGARAPPRRRLRCARPPGGDTASAAPPSSASSSATAMARRTPPGSVASSPKVSPRRATLSLAFVLVAAAQR